MADDLGCQFARLPSDWVSVAAVGVVAYIRFGNRKNPVRELLSRLDTGANDLDCDLWCAGRALREAHEAGLRESGNLYTEHSRALDRLLEQAAELAALRDALGSLHGLFGEPGLHGSIEATHDCINEHVHRLLDEEKYLRRELAARRAVDGWLRDDEGMRALGVLDGLLTAILWPDDDGQELHCQAPTYPALAAALGLEVEDA